jgi:hypothetical protein
LSPSVHSSRIAAATSSLKYFSKDKLSAFQVNRIIIQEIPKKNFIEKDLCQIKGTVLDSGDGKIKAKFYCIFKC